MLTLEKIVARLNAEPYGNFGAICKATGIPWGTLRKIKEGETTNPLYRTYLSLVRYYQRSEREQE